MNPHAPDHLRAASALYSASVLEDARVFAVAHRIAELFQQGMLPLESTAAGSRLYDYWKYTGSRMSEADRRDTYSRVFGSATDDASVDAEANGGFRELWLRYLGSLVEYGRETSAAPGEMSMQRVRDSARELAVNLADALTPSAMVVASDLCAQLETAWTILGDRDVQGVFGAADAWELIAAVAEREFGEAVDTQAAREKAATASALLDALADAGDGDPSDLDEFTVRRCVKIAATAQAGARKGNR